MAWDELVSGSEFEQGRYVVFTPEERAAATSGGGAKLVDVVQFVDQTEIDPIYYKSAYYLAPESTGVKAYEILRMALVEKGRVGICKVAIRDREHLATLRADDQVLILETMRWPDEIREASFEELETDLEVRYEEVKMAEMIIDNLTSEFDPAAWTDHSREAIQELAQKRSTAKRSWPPTRRSRQKWSVCLKRSRLPSRQPRQSPSRGRLSERRSGAYMENPTDDSAPPEIST